MFLNPSDSYRSSGVVAGVFDPQVLCLHLCGMWGRHYDFIVRVTSEAELAGDVHDKLSKVLHACSHSGAVAEAIGLARTKTRLCWLSLLFPS